ncbi:MULTISPECIES: hypothetical protein [unclassified Streptomyces]|uniref:hypothetical protein n=1 Tax=unclassified Streptomyces TaxID=2593676 RepID=UPI00131A5232|nr:MULTISPECIES: hypothetical protein [unclassified Streptomyces]
MYDAVRVAEGLSEAEARRIWHEHAAKLVTMGEAEYGRCVGVRHLGYGKWAVYVGMQDGAPIQEPPVLRK